MPQLPLCFNQIDSIMENLTLETLPKAFLELSLEIKEIKRLLLDKSGVNTTNSEQWFDLSELCSYLPDKPAKATVYGWIHTGSIPCHKGQKKLRFLKSEIDTWLMKGRKKTLLEIAGETDQYLTRKAK